MSIRVASLISEIRHYLMKFVRDLQQVCGFLGYSTNKIHRHDISEILLKVALNIIPLPPHFRVQIILIIEHQTMNTRYEVIKRFITKYKDA